MKTFSKKFKELNKQCGLCSANFEIWLSNSRINDERKEKIQNRFLSYCPACSRADGR